MCVYPRVAGNEDPLASGRIENMTYDMLVRCICDMHYEYWCLFLIHNVELRKASHMEGWDLEKQGSSGSIWPYILAENKPGHKTHSVS